MLANIWALQEAERPGWLDGLAGEDAVSRTAFLFQEADDANIGWARTPGARRREASQPSAA